MKRLCIFDLDGTLVDSIPDITVSLNVALVDCGLPVLTEEEVKRIVGRSVAYMCEHATPADRRDEWENVLAAFKKHYGVHCCDRTRAYEGVQRMTQKLRAAGLTLAVVSNKPHAEAVKVVSALFPRDRFSMILGRTDRFALKPAAEPLRFVIDYFGVPDPEVVYVGDSEVDIEFANNAGVDCVSVSWGYRTRAELTENGALVIADDPEEVADLVLRA